MKTTNTGVNWIAQRYQVNTWGMFTSMFFINANTGFVGSTGIGGGYIRKTIDGGTSWNVIILPTANLINSLYFPSASIGYAACYGGQILKTTNGGNNWFLQTTGTGSSLYSIFFINDLTGYVSGVDNTVLKTTDGGGPPIGIVQNSSEIPQNFALMQNFPNPFNPTTKIKFDLPKSNLTLSGAKGLKVTLKVYNVLGSEAAVLVNDNLNPGEYEVSWNAANFPSGIYFYRFTAGGFVETKKMMLVK
jgi:hypothetical protein